MSICSNGVHEEGRCYRAGGKVWCGWEYLLNKEKVNKEKEEKVSNCCSAPGNDLGLCAACKEHCEFVDTE